MELPLYSDSDCNGDLTCKLINLHTCGGKLQSEDHLEDWSLGLSYWMLLKETFINSSNSYKMQRMLNQQYG